MERIHSTDLLFQHSPANGGLLAQRALGTLLLWQRRISRRRELARLDEHLLSDAGISPYDRAIEVSKPFWR